MAVWPSAGLNTPSGSTRTYTHKRLGTHIVQRTQDAGMHSTCILHALFVNARLLVSVTETLPPQWAKVKWDAHANLILRQTVRSKLQVSGSRL